MFDDTTSNQTDSSAAAPLGTPAADTTMSQPAFGADPAAAPPADNTMMAAEPTVPTTPTDTTSAEPTATTDTPAGPTFDSTPTDSPADSTVADPSSDTPAPDSGVSDAAAVPTLPDTDVTSTSAPSTDLAGMKQEALDELKPLVEHLDLKPDEQFKTTMMMIQANDDQSLLPKAFEAAKQITEDKERAQALLDIINEINYFTHQNKAEE